MKTFTRRARSLRGITLVVATTMALAACGGGGDDPSGGPDGKTELTFVNYGGDGMKAAKAGWLAPYTEKTGVTFKTVATAARNECVVSSWKLDSSSTYTSGTG